MCGRVCVRVCVCVIIFKSVVVDFFFMFKIKKFKIISSPYNLMVFVCSVLSIRYTWRQVTYSLG